ncbi:MAG: type II toxin-antitoxin system RelE/ParE family toxin [Deltaproteobacteria bacterium]|nr:type II toxin-antitoxin system RelE/ParE family toxin [Deltaproteobacteria bacterium]
MNKAAQEFYKRLQEQSGSPPKSFLNSLPHNIRARFYRYLNHLIQNNDRLEGAAFRKLHDYPLEEIRIKSSKNLYWLIIHVKPDDMIIVLHGFIKREGEETPKKELEIAYNRVLKLIG